MVRYRRGLRLGRDGEGDGESSRERRHLGLLGRILLSLVSYGVGGMNHDFDDVLFPWMTRLFKMDVWPCTKQLRITTGPSLPTTVHPPSCPGDDYPDQSIPHKTHSSLPPLDAALPEVYVTAIKAAIASD